MRIIAVVFLCLLISVQTCQCVAVGITHQSFIFQHGKLVNGDVWNTIGMQSTLKIDKNIDIVLGYSRNFVSLRQCGFFSEPNHDSERVDISVYYNLTDNFSVGYLLSKRIAIPGRYNSDFDNEFTIDRECIEIRYIL